MKKFLFLILNTFMIFNLFGMKGTKNSGHHRRNSVDSSLSNVKFYSVFSNSSTNSSINSKSLGLYPVLDTDTSMNLSKCNMNPIFPNATQIQEKKQKTHYKIGNGLARALESDQIQFDGKKEFQNYLNTKVRPDRGSYEIWQTTLNMFREHFSQEYKNEIKNLQDHNNQLNEGINSLNLQKKFLTDNVNLLHESSELKDQKLEQLIAQKKRTIYFGVSRIVIALGIGFTLGNYKSNISSFAKSCFNLFPIKKAS